MTRGLGAGFSGNKLALATLILTPMLFMVIERFRGGNPKPVRDRFREHGRMLPEGVTYHASWIDPVQARCFQVMEADTAAALKPWIDRWEDVIDFEVVPVLTPAAWETV